MRKLATTGLFLLAFVLGDVLQLSSSMSAGCADEKQEALPAVAQIDCPPGTAVRLDRAPVKTMRWCQNGSGQRHGPFVAWHESTKQLRTSAQYVDGMKHGPATFYHRNGVKSSEGVFVKDYEDGKWKMWNECGNLLRVEIRNAGLKGALVELWEPPTDDWSLELDGSDIE